MSTASRTSRGATAHRTTRTHNNVNYHELLGAFYEQYNAQLLPKVEELLLQYRGQELLLFQKLERKYKVEGWLARRGLEFQANQTERRITAGPNGRFRWRGRLATFMEGEFIPDKLAELYGQPVQVVSSTECIAPGWFKHGFSFNYDGLQDVWVAQDNVTNQMSHWERVPGEYSPVRQNKLKHYMQSTLTHSAWK